MKHIVIFEYGTIPRTGELSNHLRYLQKFDEAWQVKHSGSSIFDWSQRNVVRAKNYVGVMQVGDLIIEILPKVDKKRISIDVDGRVLAQHNLLYMLSYTSKLPLLERNLAPLDVQYMPLLEALIKIFTEKLLTELKRGLDNSYITIEDNLTRIKGKIHLTNHIRHNVAHRERVYVVYDELITDTWLNRVFKGVCHKLLLLSDNPHIQKRIREAIVLLDDVSDVYIQKHHFDKVHLTRNTERFRLLLDFARFVVDHMSPAPHKGGSQTFSLLFPMDELFEEFIASVLLGSCNRFGIERKNVRPQARGCQGWLLQQNSRGKFQLKPDIVVYDESKQPRHIIDTKWKHLLTDSEDSKNGVDQSDIYQLYSYANHYKCQDNVLLYPMVEGVTPKKYNVSADPEKTIRIEFVNLCRDLEKEHAQFKRELFDIVVGKQAESA